MKMSERFYLYEVIQQVTMSKRTTTAELQKFLFAWLFAWAYFARGGHLPTPTRWNSGEKDYLSVAVKRLLSSPLNLLIQASCNTQYMNLYDQFILASHKI